MSTSKKPPVFRKFETGGDICDWIAQLHTYFEALRLWEHVQDHAEMEVEEDDEDTTEIYDARCRRDILLSLHKDVTMSVRHLQFSHQMFTRVKKIFVGNFPN